MDNNDMRAMGIITEYRASMLQPTAVWPEMEFDNRVYSIWAVDELIRYINDHSGWSVIHSIDSFRCKVSDYSRIVTHYSDANFMFKIAEEVAYNIMDILNAMFNEGDFE